jgi:hypothetical protein
MESEYLGDAAPAHSSGMIQAFAEKPGKVFLLYGDRAIFHLSLHMAAQAMTGGTSIAVVDGCNRFDVHALSRFARTRRINPNEFLKRIFISRGFTCYQMEQAIARKLPAFLPCIQSHTAMIFGLLDTFYDAQASLREVQQILRRLLHAFGEMKSAGISLLLVCSEHRVEPQERNKLFTTLKGAMDRVYKLGSNGSGAPQLVLESQRSVRGTINSTTPKQLLSASYSLSKGVSPHGTNRTDLHQSDRRGSPKLVQVSPRTAQNRSGSL